MERAFTNLLKHNLHFIFLILSVVLLSGCTNNKSTGLIEERDGLLFIQGKDQLFSGRVVDTLAQRILEYEVVDGKKNGEFRISFLNGFVQMSGNIKNNLNEGLWRYYYPNGQLESIGNFEKNVSVGKWTWYFENGKIREIGFFKDGKKDGAWTVFDEKGKIKRKIFFKDGLIIDDKNLNQSYTT